MQTIASNRKISLSADANGLLSHAGGLLLTRALAITGLNRALSRELERWRPSRAVHDLGKVIADLALGGDCLADNCKAGLRLKNFNVYNRLLDMDPFWVWATLPGEPPFAGLEDIPPPVEGVAASCKVENRRCSKGNG